MNKTSAKVIYYSCIVAALAVSYLAFDYASGRAFSGEQPFVWLSVIAFFVVIGLVFTAITIKAKFKL